MPYTVTVPARGRKWKTGAILRDGLTLYRVAGAPIHFHEDALAIQRVTKVRQIPPEWEATTRLISIMERVGRDGTHTPHSRGASWLPRAETPQRDGPIAQWVAREDVCSYASYTSIEVRGDVLRYVRPVYDDAPVVAWMCDGALADEVRALIAGQPTLTRYPAAKVREQTTS